tara:strand:- start:3047 stop:3943 length:897 start_codon:yes stop_codon:yes gene_type:complete
MVYSVQSQESLQSLQTLWNLLIQIYPCKECKTHILQILKQPYPIVTKDKQIQSFQQAFSSITSSHDFALWLHHIHNKVSISIRNQPYNIRFTQQDKTIFQNRTFESDEERDAVFQETLEVIIKRKLYNSQQVKKLGKYLWTILHTLCNNCKDSNELEIFKQFWKCMISIYPFQNSTIEEYCQSNIDIFDSCTTIDSTILQLSNCHDEIKTIVEKPHYTLQLEKRNIRTFFNKALQQEYEKAKQQQSQQSKSRSFSMTIEQDEQEKVLETIRKKSMVFQLRSCYSMEVPRRGGCGCGKR